MTQEIYQKAMKFAGEAHSNQLVPGTKANYLLHISNVTMEVILAHKHAETFDLNLAIQIAILHDSIEDTDITYEIIALEFGKDVADGVLALTKDNTLTTKAAKMQDSLNRIKNCSHVECAIVKLADRITNLQKPPVSWDTQKKVKYAQEAQLINAELASSNEYLNNRLAHKIEAYQKWL
jgi:(p)ppGpp synthase/HD superfamily hydrolase